MTRIKSYQNCRFAFYFWLISHLIRRSKNKFALTENTACQALDYFAFSKICKTYSVSPSLLFSLSIPLIAFTWTKPFTFDLDTRVISYDKSVKILLVDSNHQILFFRCNLTFNKYIINFSQALQKLIIIF